MSLFGCFNQTPRSCDDCTEDEVNRIVDVAFVKKGTTISTTSPAAAILAAELAGNAYIIRNTNGTKAAPSVKVGKGAGKQIERILAKEHQIEVTDFNYMKNVDFWNDFENNAPNYDLYYFTSTKMWKTGTTTLSVSAMDPITDDITTFIEGTFQVKWSQKGNPVPYDADVDSLANCQILFEIGDTAGFFNASGSEADIISDSEVEATAPAVFNMALETGHDLAAVSVVDGSLPTGLSVSYNDQVVYITGTASVAGTFVATIRASNSTGVSGEFTITFTIA